MTGRRGLTLLELLVAMAVASTILGVAVALVYTLLEADRGARQRMHFSSAAARLAEQFRRDVHAATAVEALPQAEGGRPSPGWQLRTGDGRSVLYGMRQGELVRSERVGGKVVRQDSFGMPRGATAAIEWDTAERPVTVRLKIEPAAGATEKGKGPALHVDAILGRDHRFIQTKEASEHETKPKP